MKKALAAFFALGAFIGVLSVSVFALWQLRLSSLNAAAAPVASQPTSIPTSGSAKGGFEASVQFFASKGITLSTTPTTPLAWAKWNTYSSSDANARQAAEELQVEFSKYSDRALKDSGLKAIYLVHDLNVDGQFRSGMPDPEVTHALYFDVSDNYLQSEKGEYMRRTFNHEFGHLIEFDKFGSYAPSDAAWASCNAKDAKYGDGGAAMYADPDFAHKTHPSYGFIDGYATSAPEEDKAEMFAYFMTSPDYVRKLAKKDAGIACKLNQTEQLIQTL